MLLRAGVEVPDFRLSTRTFYINDPKRSALNPLSWPFRLVRFWYWHMNFHIEHHMYAAVPCYNLEKLHNVRTSSDAFVDSLISCRNCRSCQALLMMGLFLPAVATNTKAKSCASSVGLTVLLRC